MSKHSGIKALKKIKKNIKKSEMGVKAQKVSMREGREKSQRQNAPDLSLPVLNKRADKRAKRDVSQIEATRRSEKTSVVEQSRNISRRYRRKSGGFLASLGSKAASLFGSRSSDNAALDFAANHKHRSKRDKRKRALMFGGIGTLAVIILLVVVLVPNGAAAPAGGDALPTGQALAAMQTDTPGMTALGAKMPVLMPFTPSSLADADDFDDDLDEDFDDPDIIDPEVEEPEAEATPVPTTKPDPTPPPVKVDDLIDFFIVEADSYYSSKDYSSNTYKYSDEEFLMLARIIDGEARGESYKGKVAVANVIMNRVLNRSAWPNDIISVVSAPGQFSVYNRVKDSSPSSSAKRAARAVLDNELWVIPQNVYFFKSSGSGEGDWGRNKYYDRIGGHSFYTYNYSGRRGGGVPPALFDRTYKYAQYGCKPEKRVYRIQYMLNKLGYNVKADRYFGKGSEDALIDFQGKNKLKADGVAGPATVKKLIEAYGVQNYYERFVK